MVGVPGSAPSPWPRNISAHVRARLTSETSRSAYTCAGWFNRPWRPVVVTCDAVRGVRACLAATDSNSRRQAAAFRGQTGVFAPSPLGDSTITPPSSWDVNLFESSSPDMGQTSIIGAVEFDGAFKGEPSSSMWARLASVTLHEGAGREDGPWQQGDLRLKGRLGHWGEMAQWGITPPCRQVESAPSCSPRLLASAVR